ncbi:MAG: hypothetical protein AUJ52_10110 [Elusimicrobia bacterium CG1_02_63_36]|nr:MAG: hypothetical protein AUJ52_10110 [Elusimicrobia bacterium CG1_02_63_36]PIP84069.1 MAG: hypothetical protein COR54_06015 [Elusimicrobia bacterium CG22_combo_CG10-13_8_21_14_all_63_91]PJA15078.1 MAG: hypothetical protein COX66_10900 [Elusimicrobia bacterium CG_4_10_14_0_2_um_filter_63_34]PJB23486.1 MAG: hypothetical protein CO113_17890 [Elusimicrobia bacterium CG_4_9_14_3_um_filter_62_55]
MLTAKEIKALFEKLDARLAKRGVMGEIGIVGGAVMCLVYDARGSTRDVDGIFEPPGIIRECAKEIAEEEGINEDWLNDGAKGYISGKFEIETVLELPNLKVWAPEPRYLFAMKCISARFDTNDADDLKFLIRRLGIKSAAEAFDIVGDYYPRKQIPTKTQYFIEEVIESLD